MLAIMPEREMPGFGRTQKDIQAGHERIMTELASDALLDAIEMADSEEAAIDFVRTVVSAVEISIADKIRLRAEQLIGSNDAGLRDAGVLFFELADSIAPQSTDRSLQQE